MNSNFKRKLLAGLFVPVIGLAAGTVLAQSSAGSATSGTNGTKSDAMSGGSWNAQTFDRLDKNRDGRISREEAQADTMLRGDTWGKLDTGNRGSVSKDEFEKYRMTQSGGAGTAPGSSPPPNSGSATPSTSNPSATPSSGGMAPK